MSSFKNRITLQVYKTSQLSEFFHHHQSEQSKTVGGKKKKAAKQQQRKTGTQRSKLKSSNTQERLNDF